MITSRAALIRRIVSALDASPSRIPVLLGGCGSGRTTVLQQLRDRIGRHAAQYVDVDRTATTPERFFRSMMNGSPFPPGEPAPPGTRGAFDGTLAFLTQARAGGSEPATFLLDEFLELRTFESFPGLRRVLHDLVDGLASSPNRFVLSSRYTARALRLLRDRSSRFEVIHVPALTAEDLRDMLGQPPDRMAGSDEEHDYTARAIQALTDGRPAYAGAIADDLVATRDRGVAGGSDAVSALVGLLAPRGAVARQCCFSYELRLHRARGYGALKAILDILAEDEGLTLTEISQRLQRTPGSTKDYLSWLEDVDLVMSRQKRYSYSDPMMRVWVRLHCRPVPPSEDDIAREVHRYALTRLPQRLEPPAPQPTPEPAMALAAAGAARSGGIIEID